MADQLKFPIDISIRYSNIIKWLSEQSPEKIIRVPSNINIPNFVGIRYSKVKMWLLEQSSEKTIQVPSTVASYDCIRHIDFLKRWQINKESFRESIYWRYELRANGSEQAADQRCENFGNMFDSVSSNSWNVENNPIAITEDGID